MWHVDYSDTCYIDRADPIWSASNLGRYVIIVLDRQCPLIVLFGFQEKSNKLRNLLFSKSTLFYFWGKKTDAIK